MTREKARAARVRKARRREQRRHHQLVQRIERRVDGRTPRWNRLRRPVPTFARFSGITISIGGVAFYPNPVPVERFSSPPPTARALGSFTMSAPLEFKVTS